MGTERDPQKTAAPSALDEKPIEKEFRNPCHPRRKRTKGPHYDTKDDSIVKKEEGDLSTEDRLQTEAAVLISFKNDVKMEGERSLVPNRKANG